MNHTNIHNQIDELAKKLEGVKGLAERLKRKNPTDLNQLSELKNELEVACDLVNLFGKENVEFLKEGNDSRADLQVRNRKSFIFEVKTIRKDMKREREFYKTLTSVGSAMVPDYYDSNKDKLWDVWQKAKQQLKGSFNILVVMTERFDFDIDTIMKFLFGGVSFDGTTLEDAIDANFRVDIDRMYDALCENPDFGFDNKEDFKKETIKINIKNLIQALHNEGLFSYVPRDLVAVAFNGIHEDRFFVNPFSRLDFDIKKLFFKTT